MFQLRKTRRKMRPRWKQTRPPSTAGTDEKYARCSKTMALGLKMVRRSLEIRHLRWIQIPRWRLQRKRLRRPMCLYQKLFMEDWQLQICRKLWRRSLKWLCRIVMEETKDKRMLRLMFYDMRNKLHDKYHEFVTESDRDQLISKLQEVEDWLYEEGEDETKGVYIAKLDELKRQGGPIEQRYKEHADRGSVIDQLIYCINSLPRGSNVAGSKFDHIDVAEKQKVLNECVEAEAWLREKKQHQDTLPKYATPVLLSADVRKKAEALDSFAGNHDETKACKPATPRGSIPASSQGGESNSQGADT
ncbi:UNVERIFIED_CONTAM: Heat shock protein 15, partial [Sesamum radiatum]